MRPSFTTIILIISIVLFSILVVNLANLVNTENQKNYVNIQNDKWLKDRRVASDVAHIDDKPNHLMWFIQVSVSTHL